MNQQDKFALLLILICIEGAFYVGCSASLSSRMSEHLSFGMLRHIKRKEKWHFVSLNLSPRCTAKHSKVYENHVMKFLEPFGVLKNVQRKWHNPTLAFQFPPDKFVALWLLDNFVYRIVVGKEYDSPYQRKQPKVKL